MDIIIDEKYLIKILSDLVHINSINPSLSPQGRGEADISGYIAKALNEIGLEPSIIQLASNRTNVVGTYKGKGSGPSLLLNGHMDTVGVEQMTIDPFKAEIKNGRLYGRGAQDMKGSLAAMIAAAKALSDSGVNLSGDLIITAVADEEFGSLGTENLVQNLRADSAIVAEPTDLKISCAHRGFIWYEVETFGKAAHGSRYLEGIDANIRMGRFLSKLDTLEKELRQRPPHPLAGPPSLHAPRVHGGSEVSIYSAHCLLEIERRTIPGESQESAAADLQEIIDNLTEDDPTFNAKLTMKFSRNPFEVGKDADIVRILEKVITSQTGLEPEHTGQTYWTDAALLSEKGIETVLFGPRGGGLHSAEEWVDIQSVINLARILAETAVLYCGT
jgi:acetylornithine deacetylase